MTTFGSGPQDFEAMARQSMQTWRDMWNRAVGQVPGWQAQAQAAPDSGSEEAVQHVLHGLQAYLEWMETVASGAAGMPAQTTWHDALGELFGGDNNPFADALAGMPGMDQFGPEQWHKAFAGGFAQQGMASMPGLPAFGMGRERQEKQQELARAWAEYQQQSASYQALLAQAGSQAVERTRDKLAEHEQPGRQIDSLRGLYNLWVDAAEEAWAEIAMSGEYREVYGAMTNAQMRVRKLLQEQVADTARQMGLPTRDEVDSLGKRLQETRRELAALRARHGSAQHGSAHREPGAKPATAATGKAATGRRAARKSASKKAASKKAASKKAASKKAASKKTVGKKAPARKSARKKSANKQAASNKAAGKRVTAKSADKTRARKSTRKSTVARSRSRSGGRQRDGGASKRR